MAGSYIRKLKAFRLRQWLVLAALVFVLGFTGYYSYRAARFAVLWHEYSRAPVRGWMNVDHVAHAQGVPREVLNEAIGLAPNAADRRPLNDIARSQNRTFEELEIEISNAIVDYREAEADAEEGGTH